MGGAECIDWCLTAFRRQRVVPTRHVHFRGALVCKSKIGQHFPAFEWIPWQKRKRDHSTDDDDDARHTTAPGDTGSAIFTPSGPAATIMSEKRLSGTPLRLSNAVRPLTFSASINPTLRLSRR